MTKTHFMNFERADESEVSVEYSITPYDPGVTWGPAETCYPPEGGEVEIVKAWFEPSGGEFTPTDAEINKWSNYIAENHDYDDCSPDDD
jgi:hypothetical protein